MRFTLWYGGRPQLVTLARGSGEFVALDGTHQTRYEMLGRNDQATLIRMTIEGEPYEIAIDENGEGNTAQLSPCEGGHCPCTIYGGENEVQGSCSNSSYPEYGEMRFTLWYGERPAVAQPAPQQPPPQQPPPQQAPQMVLLGSGSGDFNNANATFQFWGIDGQPSAMRIITGGQAYDIQLNPSAASEDTVTGQMTPPCVGGACSCEFFEEGTNYYMGSCETDYSQIGSNFAFRMPSQ
jgi:hypothetical protein